MDFYEEFFLTLIHKMIDDSVGNHHVESINEVGSSARYLKAL